MQNNCQSNNIKIKLFTIYHCIMDKKAAKIKYKTHSIITT